MAYLQGYIISVGPTLTPHSKDFFVKNLISLKESKKNAHARTFVSEM